MSTIERLNSIIAKMNWNTGETEASQLAAAVADLAGIVREIVLEQEQRDSHKREQSE